MTTRDDLLIDQEGFIFRFGVRGAVRWEDLLIRGRDVSVFVNDDRWTYVQHVEARDTGLEAIELGNPNVISVPSGAEGRIDLLSRPRAEPHTFAARFGGLQADSVLAVVVDHPDTGYELKRFTFRGCRWGPPSIEPLMDSHRAGGLLRYIVSADFKADYYD